jgi:hypothetical protein
MILPIPSKTHIPARYIFRIGNTPRAWPTTDAKLAKGRLGKAGNGTESRWSRKRNSKRSVISGGFVFLTNDETWAHQTRRFEPLENKMVAENHLLPDFVYGRAGQR